MDCHKRNGPHSLKTCFLYACGIFSFALIIGALTGLLTDSFYLDLIMGFSGKGQITVSSIFWHNLGIDLTSIAVGALLGIVPVLVLLVNGFVPAYLVVAILIYMPSISPWILLYGIGPHAIPELFALIFSAALGFRLYSLISLDKFRYARQNLKKEIIKLAFFVIIVIVINYTAAYTEVNISAELIKPYAL